MTDAQTEARAIADPYLRIVDFFDGDETAGAFLREDGDGGFTGAAYRMAREIDALREVLAAKDAELAAMKVKCQALDDECQQSMLDIARERDRAERAEAQLAERTGGVNEDALRALAQAYDREDAAQRGEPNPWNLDDPGDIGDSDTWVSERLGCARAAAEAFLSALSTGAHQ